MTPTQTKETRDFVKVETPPAFAVACPKCACPLEALPFNDVTLYYCAGCYEEWTPREIAAAAMDDLRGQWKAMLT